MAGENPIHDVIFRRSGRGPAQCPPNPDYPHGMDLDAAGTAPASCTVKLPYPAPECGHFLVSCHGCGLSVGVTAAGRPDDPSSIKLPCRPGRGFQA